MLPGLKALNPLYFPARKVTDTGKNPPRHHVKGEPASGQPEVDYNEKKRDFDFASYQDGVLAGLARYQLIFGKDPRKLRVFRFGKGTRLQWFETQLFNDAHRVKIKGDDHVPAFGIRQSYDNPTVVNYYIGIYRDACNNGMVFDHERLKKLRVKSGDVWDIDFYYLRCLWQTIVEEYKDTAKMLTSTTMDASTARSVIGEFLRRADPTRRRALRVRWSEHEFHAEDEQGVHWPEEADRLWTQYEHQHGPTGWAALNTVTDLASNYIPVPQGGRHEQEDIAGAATAAVFDAQRKAGLWVRDLANSILQSNEGAHRIERDVESERFGRPVLQDEYRFDLRLFLPKDNKRD